jgi:hypothetical protein
MGFLVDFGAESGELVAGGLAQDIGEIVDEALGLVVGDGLVLRLEVRRGEQGCRKRKKHKARDRIPWRASGIAGGEGSRHAFALLAYLMCERRIAFDDGGGELGACWLWRGGILPSGDF